jgi:hypothetical protein
MNAPAIDVEVMNENHFQDAIRMRMNQVVIIVY